MRQIRGGHPWVFDSSVRSAARAGEPGDLAVVFGERREFVAIGLWDPTSPLRIRILHHGSPTTIDRAFWQGRLTRSIAHRASLVASDATSGFRVVHGENDALPGLVIDVYDTTAVVKLYTAAWFPHLADLLGAFDDAAVATGLVVDRVVVRLARNVAAAAPAGLADGVVLAGSVPDAPIVFHENGLRFEADVIGGQKTGHFLDQRDNREIVRGLALERSVLDVFACTGGFSVHAAAGGATSVTAVDLSRRSLDTAERNWDHNAGDVESSRLEVVVGDAFEVMSRLRRERRTFDVVVVDPPSFAHRAADRDRAIAAYERLAEAGLALVGAGGVYVQSSCSSRVDADGLRGAVLAGADRAGRPVRVERETDHALDHPIGFAHGAYLSTIFLDVDR